MLSKLAGFTTRRPRLVLLVSAVVAAACIAVSAGVPQRLATQGFYDTGSESQQAIDKIAAAAGFDPTEDLVLVVTAPDGNPIDSAAGRKAVDEAIKKVEEIDGVVSTASPFAGPREAATAISKDGKQAIVLAHVEPNSEEGDLAEVAIEAFEGDAHVLLGGGMVAQHYVSSTVSEDLARSELIVFPILFLISLFVFRSLFAALLPMLVGMITIPLTMTLISFYNEITSLSIFALNLTTGLGLGLAIDYSLLLITRYREELALGKAPPQALATTMNTAGRTIVFSAFTVAGAVMVLGIFPVKFLYSMALAGSTVAIASAVVALTFLPAALILLGSRLDRFSISRSAPERATERWYGLAKRVMHRPLLTTAIVLAAIFVVMLPIRDLAFTSVDPTVLPATNQAHMVHTIQQEDFPAESNSTVVVQVDASEQDAPQVARLHGLVSQIDGVTAVSPPAYLGKDTWSFNVVTKETFYAASALTAIEDIRDIASVNEHRVGGVTADFFDQRASIMSRVPLALFLILAVTFVVLFLMTASVVLPIKTFIMNLLTLGATFGILTWIFGQGHLQGVLDYKSVGALEMTQPVVLFVIAFALATDYGVFLLGRIKELRDQGLSNNESVAQGIARTGRVITSAALLFCIAIGAFSLSGIVFIKQLGIGTALAVAIDATIIRALLVPALMTLLGEYNWWAPRWMKRLHARIGFSEGPSAELAPPQLASTS